MKEKYMSEKNIFCILDLNLGKFSVMRFVTQFVHMFLDIPELGVENKKYSLDKIVFPQICEWTAQVGPDLLWAEKEERL